MPQPIANPETYVALRAAIDAGTTAVSTWHQRAKDGCTEKCTPPTQPDLGTLADMIYTYIPQEMISVVPAQTMVDQLPPPENEFVVTEDDLVQGWPTFADREQLIVALEKVTPPEVRAELEGKLEGPPSANAGEGWTGADEDGLSWWAVALAAGGVLAWLGRRNIWGFVLSIGVEKLFRMLLAGGAALALAYQAEKLLDAAGDAGARTLNLVPIIIGGVVVVGLVVTTVIILNRRRERTRAA